MPNTHLNHQFFTTAKDSHEAVSDEMTTVADDSISSFSDVVPPVKDNINCSSLTSDTTPPLPVDLSGIPHPANNVEKVTTVEAKRGILTAIAYFQLHATHSEENYMVTLYSMYKTLCEIEALSSPLEDDIGYDDNEGICVNSDYVVKKESVWSQTGNSISQDMIPPLNSGWSVPKEDRVKPDELGHDNQRYCASTVWEKPSISDLWELADAHDKCHDNNDLSVATIQKDLSDASKRPLQSRKANKKRGKISNKNQRVKTKKAIANITESSTQNDLLPKTEQKCKTTKPQRKRNIKTDTSQQSKKVAKDSDMDYPYECQYCGEHFKVKILFLKHETGHTGKRPLICPVCGQGFFVQSNMKKHMRIHTGERPFLCTICGKSFNQGGILNLHMNTHTGEKNFKCDICDRAFSQPGNLQEHKLMAHTTHRPHVCTVCNKAFLHKSRLVTHFRMHSGEKPFNCELCHKSFAVKHYLNLHMNRHMGKKPHKCDLCGDSFGSTKVLRDHMRRHTGERPFCCTLCGKTFSQRSSLYNHGRVHKKEMCHYT